MTQEHDVITDHHDAQLESAEQLQDETPHTDKRSISRRNLVKGALASLATISVISKSPATAHAQGEAGGPVTQYGPNAEPVYYPNTDVHVLDPERFTAKQGNAPIRRLWTGGNWLEGPAYSYQGKYLVWSDINANHQQRYLEEDGHVSVFRSPSGNSNGNNFDWQGRQLSCEHLNRRVIRWEHDGSMTVLADSYNGQPFNSPNDVVVHENGSVWFTDPPYGSLFWYEGLQRELTQPVDGLYRIDPDSGEVTLVSDELLRPNGLCFSPDFSKLYVVTAEEGAAIVVFDVDDAGTSLSNVQTFTDTSYDGLLLGSDGVQADVDGNIWASSGWQGPGYDGVHCYAADNGERIGQILIPETTANLVFGGPKRNRLYIAASQSIYAVELNTQGAHIS
jgi:gluconolactonase